MTYAEATAALRTHYEVTGSRDLAEAELRLAHLDPFFSGYRPVASRQRTVKPMPGKRKGEGAANGIIDRELAVLGRMLRLAHEDDRLARVPKIRKLTDAAPRAGFDEILTLQRRQLDLAAGTLGLETGATKNDDGREVDLTDELHILLAAQVEGMISGAPRSGAW